MARPRRRKKEIKGLVESVDLVKPIDLVEPVVDFGAGLGMGKGNETNI